jgi:hypothetical protein
MSKKILLISSDFFGYYKMIQLELEKQGWDVTYIHDRPANNAIVKILIRKFKWLITSYLTHFFKNKLVEVCKGQKFDQVLVIKGEGLTPAVFRDLYNYTSGPITLYFWDNIKNIPGGLANSAEADHTFTFDPVDTEEHGFQLLPLFYVDEGMSRSQIKPEWELSFVGSIHSDRLRVIADVREKMTGIGKTFIFIYFASSILYNFRRWFDPSFKFFKSEELSLKSLSRQQTEEIFQKSVAVLDVHHIHQTGLTMRTLEALALGKKLITTNSSIKSYPFYDSNQILIIDRKNPELNSNFFKLPNSLKVSEAIKAYEIGRWVQTLTLTKS